MSRSWTGNYEALSPDAIQVLRAMVLLELPTLVTDELAAIVGREPAQVDAAMDTLRRTRWIQTEAPSAGILSADVLSADVLSADVLSAEILVEEGRRWLADVVAGTAEPTEVAELAGRYAGYLARGLDVARHERDLHGTGQHEMDPVVRWVGHHRDRIVGAIRIAVQAGQSKVAVELATAVWEVAGQVPDRSVLDRAWLGELAQCGEDAARAARDRDALFTLLDRSAAVFVQAGDPETAVRQWVRALKLADDHGEHDRGVRILNALGELYRQWGRLSKAIDTYIELVDEHQRAGEPVAAAGALTELGAVMLDARRPADATVYLSRADELLIEAAPEPTVVAVHARTLELWGHALRRTDKRGPARRRWERALAMLADQADTTDDTTHDTAADRVRGLLANPDEPLAD